MGTASKDKRDIYYRKAKEEGWRARSAFKLLQIEDSNQIFKGVRRVVDLCAAPGSWSQVLSRRLYLPAKRAGSTDLPKIVAVDLQPMAPIEGITTIQGDITSEETIAQILQHFEDEKADLVISDGAPDVTGMHDMDQYVQGQLIVAALTIVGRVLREGGTFVAKIFRGKDISLLYSQLKVLFPEVSVVKPWSSRNSSIEAFVLCRHYTPPADFEAAAPALLHMLLFKSSTLAGQNVLEASLGTGADTKKICGGVLPFLACGSLQWDSDMTYDLEEVEAGSDKATERLQPVQPPLAPHYKEAMEKINRWRF